MERLYEIFDIKLRNVPMKFKRFLSNQIDWDNRLISIQGARGSGKTTLVMQYIKQQFKKPSKQIYDTYYDIKVIITGSSILEIKKGEADLSRRVVSYLLPGLSFREFLELDKNLKFDSISLESILNNHLEITHTIAEDTRPLEYFDNYLKYGYYPYFVEGQEVYPEKLQSTITILATNLHKRNTQDGKA